MTQSVFSHVPQRIVSGGQTGVDRGALDAAIALGIPHGGWCPRGRLSEDGQIPARYNLTELASPRYKDRTLQNVLDSDATLILYCDTLRGGTRLTQRYAIDAGKPLLAVAIDVDWSLESVRRWLYQYQPLSLNIAGPRESNFPGVQVLSREAVLRIFDPSR
ncbi:putative molybdenum carrier protein [Rosistilla oblonga]|uniref:putative molybdenum carrier protein n=1 Tax=Rosistilla oblonga TaxID=2527990 RepID=UPI003A96D869